VSPRAQLVNFAVGYITFSHMTSEDLVKTIGYCNFLQCFEQ